MEFRPLSCARAIPTAFIGRTQLSLSGVICFIAAAMFADQVFATPWPDEGLREPHRDRWSMTGLQPLPIAGLEGLFGSSDPALCEYVARGMGGTRAVG